MTSHCDLMNQVVVFRELGWVSSILDQYQYWYWYVTGRVDSSRHTAVKGQGDCDLLLTRQL